MQVNDFGHCLTRQSGNLHSATCFVTSSCEKKNILLQALSQVKLPFFATCALPQETVIRNLAAPQVFYGIVLTVVFQLRGGQKPV